MRIHNSGEVGASSGGAVLVWDAKTLEVKSRLVGFKEGAVWAADSRGVSAVAFGGKDAKLLVTVGMAEGNVLALYDWEQAKMLSFVRTDVPGILCVSVHFSKPKLVSCGTEHLAFWELTKSRLQKTKPVYGRIATERTMVCARYVKTPTNSEDVVLSGSIDGAVFVWVDGHLTSMVAAHDGPIHDMWISQSAISSTILSVGEDASLWLWSYSMNENKLSPVERVVLTQQVKGVQRKSADGAALCCRAVACRPGGHALVGTSCNEIVYVKYSEVSRTINDAKVVLVGHAEGDVTALACHPGEANVVITAAKDRTLRMWNTDMHVQMTALELTEENTQIYVTQQDAAEDHEERDAANWCTCMDFHPGKGDLLAVGMHRGGVLLVDVHTDQGGALEIRNMHIGDKGNRAVVCLKFALSRAESERRDALVLAIAMWDGVIDIYKLQTDVTSGGNDFGSECVHLGSCRGPCTDSPRIHMDWDVQGTTLMASSGAEHLTFWDLRYAEGRPRCRQRRAVEVRDMEWASSTCILGWPLQGVYAHTPEASIVAVHAARVRPLCVVAAGDGALSLFRFPSPDPCAPVSSVHAHQFGVTCARILRTDNRVISAGGTDGCVAQWCIEAPSNVKDPAPDAHVSDTDVCMDATMRALQQRHAVQERDNKKHVRQSVEGGQHTHDSSDEAFMASFHPYLSAIREPQDPLSVPEPDMSPPEDELT
jgi:microtubule-associated protein-like 6